MKFKDIGILIFSISLLIIPGCLEMEVVDQPTSAAFGSSFSSEVGIEFIIDGSFEDDDYRAMLFAVNKPIGWTIDSITYVSPEYGTGHFNYLGNDADEHGPDSTGGIDVGWEDALEVSQASADGMHWQMYVSDQDTTSTSTEADPDSFHVVVNYTVDDLEGNYMLKYYTTHTNNNTVDDADNIAMAERHITVYDPSLSPLVTFTLTDGTWTFENVKFTGEMSDWNTFQGYDDGTHGDATADDFVWTGQLAVIEDGNYEWGAVEDDGSANGIWLLEGGNQTFDVSGIQVGGSTDYVVPAFTADPAGSIVFTLKDGTADYLDIKFKGSHNNWALIQMYDDGTNGDETAGDHLWTAVVPDIPAGLHTWGAIEDDGSNYGIWLTSGPDEDRQFFLENDLVTYHGRTHYEIDAPEGEPTMVTLSFIEGPRLNGARGNLREVRFKGEHSDWAVYPGDLNGRTWSADYLVNADGIYSWGAINTVNTDGTLCDDCDGSDGVGTWLMEGSPNPQFGVQNGQVGGVTSWVIPPDSAVSENTVMFTVHNGRPDLWMDLRWKGEATQWLTRQMYDDGTNGDETASDNIWTVLVEDVPTGAQTWGVIDTDNGNGTNCDACDPTDSDGTGTGTWLIDNEGNPKFKLENDNLTLRGDLHYEIPAPAGPDVTKTVLFNVDMTEWLDEEGNTGLRVFSIANGDVVRVHGSFNQWANCSGCEMTRGPGTNLFSVAIEVESQPDSEHLFAYYMQLSAASKTALEQRFGVETLVDYIGWETSPIEAGNRPFVLGPDDGGANIVELPTHSFYDAFPGSVIPEDHNIEVTWSIDMSTDNSGFNPDEDSIMYSTQDKWYGITTGASGGDAAAFTGAVPVGDGIYEFTWSLTGPLMWYHQYKWGYKDMSMDGTEVFEAGGGLGSAARIRFFRQVTYTDDDDCAWPSTFTMPLDSTFIFEGESPWAEFDPAAICVTLVPLANDGNLTVPDKFTVSNNYPNPFNPSTQVEISLPMDSDISFKVYSLTGVEIYSYTQNAVSMGKYKIKWNGKDSYGRSLPSGVYIYEFKAGDQFHQTKKMTLLK